MGSLVLMTLFSFSIYETSTDDDLGVNYLGYAYVFFIISVCYYVEYKATFLKKSICIIVFIFPFFGHLFTSLLTNNQFRLCSKPDAISEETGPPTPTPTYYAGNQENPVFKILKSRREMTKDERDAQI